jgi:hypothetical protein
MHKQFKDPRVHFTYDPENENELEKFNELKALSECFTTKRKDRNGTEKSEILDNNMKSSDRTQRYRAQWLSLIRELWGDRTILTIINPNPSTTTVAGVLHGFEFICRTIAKNIFERLLISNVNHVRVLVKEGEQIFTKVPLSIISEDG